MSSLSPRPHPPCPNFNCSSTSHPSQLCPLPPICSGCHSDNHLWPQCTEQCSNCGAAHHEKGYCYDFEPGSCNKPWNYPREVPLGWPYPLTYKTTYENITNGDSRFGPQGRGLLMPTTPSTPFRPSEAREISRTNTNQDQGIENRAIQMAPLHVLGNTARVLKDVAKSHADFWTQCSEMQPGSQAAAASFEGTNAPAYTSDLPLLPTPKPLQTPKRAREEVPTITGATNEGRRVIVRNLPHAATRQDLQWLINQYDL